MVDGKANPTGVRSTAAFTPRSSTGSVSLEFKLPAQLPSGWVGQKLVAFETVSQSGVTVAIHADVTDEGHTVHVSAIGTTATNANAELGKTVTAGKLIDVIAYSNLLPGKQYRVAGEFQVVVDGKARPTGIKGSAVFTPSSSSGTVTVTFPVSAAVVAKYAGTHLVDFETLTQAGVIVAAHADANDAGQTVSVPKIGTTASNIDPELGKTVTAGKLIDVISYTNLVPGKEYVAQGEC